MMLPGLREWADFIEWANRGGVETNRKSGSEKAASSAEEVLKRLDARERFQGGLESSGRKGKFRGGEGDGRGSRAALEVGSALLCCVFALMCCAFAVPCPGLIEVYVGTRRWARRRREGIRWRRPPLILLSQRHGISSIMICCRYWMPPRVLRSRCGLCSKLTSFWREQEVVRELLRMGVAPDGTATRLNHGAFSCCDVAVGAVLVEL
eukprot:1016300-Rhodomonas_salina.1